MKRQIRRLVFTVSLLILSMFGFASGQDLNRGLRNYLKIISGELKVEQLNKEELREVLIIYQKMKSGGSGKSSRPSYIIEVAHNDELFIINGEKYEAKTYCFGFDEGDRVIFLEGSPLGVCVSAEILNINNDKRCRLWCE